MACPPVVNKYLLLAELLGYGLLVADLCGHRDELSGRRFARLPSDVVQGELDKSRNSRWHRLGAIQRLLYAVAAGVVAYYASGKEPLAGLLATLAVGAEILLGFDIIFNKRSGLAWDYAGTTASLDRLAGANIRRLAGAKAVLLLAGVVGWLIWV